MRILVVTPWFPDEPGGREGNFVFDSVMALRGEGHQVRVLVVRPFITSRVSGAALKERFQTLFELDLIFYLSIPRNYLRRWSNASLLARVVPGLKRIARDFQPDVMHLHTEGLSALSKYFSPTVVTIHGFNQGSRYLNDPEQNGFIQAGFDCAQKVVFVGPTLLAEYQRLFRVSDDTVRVVPNGYSLPEHSPSALLSKQKALNLISVSNLVMSKGIDLVLDAVAKLPTDVSWHYRIVGDGPRRSALERQCRHLGIADKVTFEGRCPPDKVVGYLSLANVFVLPSWIEAFGIAYVEAMATGLFSIGVRGQGPEVFIDHLETGYLVEPRSIESIVEALLWVQTHSQEAIEIARAGQERVVTDFTWQGHAVKLVAVFQEAIELAGKQK